MCITRLGKASGRCGMGNKVMRKCILPDKMVFCKGEIDMNEKQARALGGLLRAKRQELGYSTYELANAAGVNSSTVVRIELGRFTAPSPGKLAKFAEALGLSLGEIYAKAGYIVPNDLPELETYLRIKYPTLTGVKRRALTVSLNEALNDEARNIKNEPSQEATHEAVD